MNELESAGGEIRQASFPNIRLLSVEFNYAGYPIQYFRGEWELCSPMSVEKFSAVGYYFAVKLYQELNIPIGIISSGAGGSVVQACIPRADLESDELLKKTYLDSFDNSIRVKEPIEGNFTWDRLASLYILYNAMISPFINLSIKGFIWYQGESNAKERETYLRATKLMIDSWRRMFQQGDLPFYYVQIAPYKYENNDLNASETAFFREVQSKIRNVKNTEMVAALDIGNPEDIHPRNKKSVGLRLAITALNHTYCKKTHYLGP